MKLDRWMSTGVLSLFLGTFFFLGATALTHAQDQRDEAKPVPTEREAAKPSQDEPAPRREEAKPSKQQDQNEDKPARGNAEKPARNEDKPAKQGENRSHAEQGGQSAEAAHGNSGRRGGHIPDEKFHANFGHQHTFKMQRPTVVQGQPTFHYGGYSFILVDVWPVGWGYSDECYIDYIDGEYFLFDLAHPDVRLAIVVVL